MFRHMDQKARMKYRKDCDEVFPGIIVGNGECIKDVRYIFFSIGPDVTFIGAIMFLVLMTHARKKFLTNKKCWNLVYVNNQTSFVFLSLPQVILIIGFLDKIFRLKSIQIRIFF